MQQKVQQMEHGGLSGAPVRWAVLLCLVLSMSVIPVMQLCTRSAMLVMQLHMQVSWIQMSLHHAEYAMMVAGLDQPAGLAE